MVSGAKALAAAYDAIAHSYDERLAADFWVRLILWDTYERCFNAGHTVLDAGCGTGIDSRFLAELGVTVLAGDASPGMLALASGEAVHRLLMDLNRPSVVQPGSLDGMVLGFAAFNTARSPIQFAREAALLIKPGGHIILHLLNGRSIWDTLALAHEGQIAEALSHRREYTAMIAGRPVNHRVYKSRWLYERAFARDFALVGMRGIGALRPPAGMRFPWAIAAALEGVEGRWGGSRALVDWGRFSLLTLRRR